MNDFFDISLMNRNFVVGEEEYTLLLQMCISPFNNSSNRILVLVSKRHEYQLRIVAWDSVSQSTCPILSDTVAQTIYALKKITFPEKYRDSISGLPAEIIIEDQTLHFEMVRESVGFLVSANPPCHLVISSQIELEFDADTKLSPQHFVYSAFDGLKMQICFELNTNDINKIKNWGILSPIKVHHNKTNCGEYYALKVTTIATNTMSFICEPRVATVLGRQTAGHIHVENMNPFHLSDFLISSAGLNVSVELPEGHSFADQWHMVVIPVSGLLAKKDFGIGNVQFCTAQNEEVQRICAFTPRLSEYNLFALVNVNSDKLYDAFARAKKQIEQAIDLLVNILKDDSLYSIHATGTYLLDRTDEYFEQKITLPPLVYIEVPFTSAKLTCDLTEIITTPKNLSVEDSFYQIQHELNKIELLLLKANGTNDKEITPLFNSLKWIRRAWDADDFDDKIIYSIIALEFIVSKEPNIPMMDKSLRKKCKGALRKILDEIKDPRINKVLYSQQVCEKFDRTYTETPFMGKLRNLITRLSIPISASDMDLIAKARKQRNEIVHGENDSKLPTDEVYKLCECISKIAFYKLLSLEA